MVQTAEAKQACRAASTLLYPQLAFGVKPCGKYTSEDFEGSDEAFTNVAPPNAPGVDPLAYYRVDPADTDEIEVEDEELIPVWETTVTVEVDVENVGSTAGDETVTLLADNEPVTESTIDADPGESATVTGTVAFDNPGEHAVVVSGDAVVDKNALTTVEVVEEGVASGSPAERDSDAGRVEIDGESPVDELGGTTIGQIIGGFALLAIVLTTLLLAW
ncbi:hypothetical protein JCM17823_04080 [Halorubrum gandharaense]